MTKRKDEQNAIPTEGSMADTRSKQPSPGAIAMKQAATASLTDMEPTQASAMQQPAPAAVPATAISPNRSKIIGNKPDPNSLGNRVAIGLGNVFGASPESMGRERPVDKTGTKPNPYDGLLYDPTGTHPQNVAGAKGWFKPADAQPAEQAQPEAAIPTPEAQFSTPETLAADQTDTANQLKLFASNYPQEQAVQTRERRVYAPAYAQLKNAEANFRKIQLENEAMAYLRNTMNPDEYAMLAAGFIDPSKQKDVKFKDQFQVVTTKQDDGFGGSSETQTVLTQGANGEMLAIPMSDFAGSLKSPEEVQPPSEEVINQYKQFIVEARKKYSSDEWEKRKVQYAAGLKKKGLNPDDFDL